MNNKKSWAVFCIATIALIIAFGAYILMKKSDLKTTLPQVNIEAEDTLSDVENTNQTTSLEETIKEPIIKQTTQQTKKSNITSQTTPQQKEIPLIQVEEEEEVAEEPAQLPSVYKDTQTNDIVITTEYKITSPSKYSFK